MSALLLAIPLTIFVLFVAPIWLWLHYSNRQQTGIQLSQQEMQRLAQLAEDAKRMRERIQALEEIQIRNTRTGDSPDEHDAGQ